VKYRKTVLNVSSGIFIIGCLIYTIVDYNDLSSGEGWGVVSMIGLMGVGLLNLFIDLVFQVFIRNRFLQNVLGTLTVIIFTVLIVKEL
jgi:FtsH-binding integral membrane protein